MDQQSSVSPALEPTSQSGPQVGDLVGAYRLVRLLGQGATGSVFEVEHTKIGRRAAMKVLTGEHATRPGAVRRLFQEAQAVNRIKHPNIVDVTDLIEGGADGVNAIVMELLEGESLAQTMLRQAPLPGPRVLAILRQVTDALAAAHGAYFVHRDLKPENVFLVGRGDVVKLLDFGLAKVVDGAGPAMPAPQGIGRGSYHTVEGTFVGTPAYSSPEQASAKRVDHRTDLYSLGVILYELLSGRLPFEGRNFGEFLVKHLTMPVPAIARSRLRTPLQRQLAAIAYKCLEKQPEDRFASAGDVGALLDALAAGTPVTIPAAKVVKHAAATGKQRRPYVIVAASLLLLSTVVVVSLQRRQAPPPAIAPRQIMVSFQSDPPGAEVRRVGQGTVLGRTPVRLALPNQEAQLQFEFRLAGFASQRVDATAGRDQSLRVKLAPALPPAPAVEAAEPTPPPPKKAHRAPPRGSRIPGARGLTVDPFVP
ncbi:MAG: serine/threonine-protein kinase [Deltaproteobacteria bacterium]|nr:serine/threonine-protein kinase [Deltaproteobacteria bacterium]